jgi:SAM-dependent methyltransferase
MTQTNSERFRFSTIAHGSHRYLSPLSSAKAERLLRRLTALLVENDVILDAGCGKAALLCDALSLSPAKGVAVDINASFIEDARRMVSATAVDLARVDFYNVPLLEHPRPIQGYAAIICVGSTHAFGSFDECLRVCMEWLKPGGRLLVADGYWKQRPAPEYLDVLNGTEDEFVTHAENAERARIRGYSLVCTATSNDDEWDEYEGKYCGTMMDYLRRHSNDPDAETFASRIQTWHKTYLDCGRATLGFGYYVLERP